MLWQERAEVVKLEHHHASIAIYVLLQQLSDETARNDWIASKVTEMAMAFQATLKNNYCVKF